jgi:hypothetical protein
MGSSTASYRKPAQSTSGKTGLNSPHELVPLVKASSIHPRRRIVLLAMLECNAFAVEGSTNELYPATLTVAVMLGLPPITVRRAIDALETKDKVLTLVRSENSPDRNGNLIRPRTYQVIAEKLCPRMTLSEHRKLRYARHRKQELAKPIIPIDQPMPPKPPSPSAPAPAKKVAEGRSLTTRQRKELVLRIPVYLQGDGRGHQGRNSGEWIAPGHPDYRASLGKFAATLMACGSMCETDGVALKRALEAAEEAGFKIPSLDEARKEALAAGYQRVPDLGESGKEQGS